MNQSDTGTDRAAVVDYDFIIACGYVFIQTAICAIGFILNLINFGVFVQPAFTAPTYIMMKFLSLADAATLGFRIPQGYIFFPRVYDYYTDAVVYVYVYSTYVEVPFTNMSENISAWLTVSLAIERYITMKHWSIAKRYFTPQNTRRLVFAICLFAIVFNTPYFATQVITLSQVNETLELKSNLTSFYRSNYYATYSWLRIVLVQIIPLCFLCISNCLLFALVSQHNQKFSQKNDTSMCEMSEQRKHGKNQRSSSRTSFAGHYSNYEPNIKSTLDCTDQGEFNGLNRSSHANGNSPKTAVQLKNNSCKLDLRTGSQIYNDNDEIKHHLLTVSDITCPNTAQLQSTRNNVENANQRSTHYDRLHKRRTAQKKLTILLIAVILLFLIGQVPQSLAYIRVFAALGICSTNGLEQCIAHHFYRMITVNLSHLAFTLNFFVYLFLNRDFRNCLTRCKYAAKCPVRPRFFQNNR